MGVLDAPQIHLIDGIKQIGVSRRRLFFHVIRRGAARAVRVGGVGAHQIAQLGHTVIDIGYAIIDVGYAVIHLGHASIHGVDLVGHIDDAALNRSLQLALVDRICRIDASSHILDAVATHIDRLARANGQATTGRYGSAKGRVIHHVDFQFIARRKLNGRIAAIHYFHRSAGGNSAGCVAVSLQVPAAANG